MMSSTWAFARAWLDKPLRMGAITPSGSALGELMTAEIIPEDAPVLELGPGTGAVTRAVLDRGVPEEALTLVEVHPAFVAMLRERFPRARVYACDATNLGTQPLFETTPAAVALSSLPLRSMNRQAVETVLQGTFAHLCLNGALYQYTYGLRCPVPDAMLEGLHLRAVRMGTTLANVPPATVYRIERASHVTG